MKKAQQIFKNHIVLTEQLETLVFCLMSILAFGYWRSSALYYGWRFILRPEWWLRYIVSLILIIPLILCDGAWTRLREKMYPYNRAYGYYGQPLFSHDLNNLQTRADWIHLAKNTLLIAISVYVVIFMPLSDWTAAICYAFCLLLVIVIMVFASIMALKEYIQAR